MDVCFGICMEKLHQHLHGRNVLCLRVLKLLSSIEKIQPRMMCPSFNGNSCTTIISYYSPTNAGGETDIITFYNEVSSLVRSIPNHTYKSDIDVTNNFCLNNPSNRILITEFSLER